MIQKRKRIRAKSHHVKILVVPVLLIPIAAFGGWYISERNYSGQLSRHDATQKTAIKDLTAQLNQTREKQLEAETAVKQLKQQAEHKLAVNVSLPHINNGHTPVISKIETKEPVVFLGIDDGAYKDKKVVELLKKNNIKATLFLSDLFIKSDPDFFKQIITQGSIVENHTLTHDTNMSGKSLAYQKSEICGMSDKIEKYYGRRPYLFRPPGGAYTAATQQAAADCGVKVIVNWIAKANGGSMQYQVGNKLQAGDIVLMHFRPEFGKDPEAFVRARDAAGLHTELLEDWIPDNG